MNLSEHFTLHEFTRSAKAEQLNLDNQLPPALMPNAMATASMLEAIRDCLTGLAGREIPVEITSGYRSPGLNLVIRGVAASDHCQAMAADIVAPAFGTPFEVAAALAPIVRQLGIGQLILEFGAWVHVSTRRPDAAINAVLTRTETAWIPGISRLAA